MSELQQRIDSVARKADLLAVRDTMLRRDKAELLDRVSLMEAEAASLRSQIEELNRRLEYLTVISVVEPTAKERETVRSRLARLLHDIDQCIADLSDCNEG